MDFTPIPSQPQEEKKPDQIKPSFPKFDFPIPSRRTVVLLIFIFLLASFGLGFMIRGSVAPMREPFSPPTITPTPTPLDSGVPTHSQEEIPQDVMQFLPGKEFFEDTLILMTKETPRKIVQISVTRVEQDVRFRQFTKINYFDGSKWHRSSITHATANSDIDKDSIISGWVSGVGPASPFEKKTTISFTSENIPLKFQSSRISEEINTRSDPSLSKYIYHGSGTLSAGNDTFEAFSVYTRTFSIDASSLSFFSSPQSLTTSWVAFWADDGRFYYLDSIKGLQTQRISHQYTVGIGAKDGTTVQKISSVSISKEKKEAPERFIAEYSAPIEQEVTIGFNTTLVKSPIKQYLWLFGGGEGIVKGTNKDDKTEIKGLGLAEYIN